MTEDFIDGGASPSPGAPALSFDGGYFLCAEPVPPRARARSSSGKKYVYRGTYVRALDAGELRVPACAIFFAREGRDVDYARERAGLVLGSALGVGPRTLEVDASRRLPDAGPDERALPMLVEEDVGVSLEDALRGAPVPRFSDGAELAGEPLPDPSTPEGPRVAHKILFDVLCQVEALHRQGLYHRDLRSANVALRSWGPGAEGVRATLLDLEFLTGERRGLVRCAPYYDRLFAEGGLACLGRAPTLLEQDLGYLAVLAAEVLCGRAASELADDEVRDVLRSPRCPLRVGPAGAFSRRLLLRDVWREARLAGLPTVGEAYGHVSARAVAVAQGETRHAGYVDTLDRIRLERSVEMILEQQTIERLARAVFENYREHRRRDGLDVEYETFDEQPEDFRESCLEQARSYCDKVRLLGCELVLAQECDEASRVRSLSEDEVEFLARVEHDRWVEERTRAGWTYGAEKDVERRVSPYLVGWEELSDEVREYDRAPMREMIALVESAGLAVTR